MKLKALLEEAQANLEFQEKFYARQQDLHASGQLSQNQFDEFTQNYKVAKARVDQTKYALELEEKTFNNLFIKSPDKGIVIAKKIDMGQMITSVLQATVLYEIAPNLNDMEGYIDVDEADIGMVKENQSVVFSVDAFPKTKFKAKVDRIQYLAKIIDNVVTYATIIRVKNPTLSLRPGMTINVDIKVAKSKKGLSIPNKALRLSSMTITEQAKAMKIACDVADKSQNKKSAKGDQEISKHVKTMQDFIWVMDAGKIKQTKVKLGVNDGKFTEVLEGITASTEVITEVEEIPKENVVLQAIFAKPGGIGK
jgi:HlyD family secretion protein